MKNTSFRFLYAVALAILLSTTVFASEPWEGRFQWNNKGHEEEYGNVYQWVHASLEITGPQELTISCSILWREGTLVEFGAAVPRSNVIRRVAANGEAEYAIQFDFTDSHENPGKCEVVVKGNVLLLEAHATSIQDRRAARQYGRYTLTRTAVQ